MAEEKCYEILDDGNKLIAKLQQKYPKILWAVIPDQVIVLGVTNKERPKSSKKLAMIRKVSPAMRTVIRTFGHKEVKQVIEVYCSDWNKWSNPRRQVIIFHELLHVAQEDLSKGLIKHDLEDFAGLVDFFGVDYWEKENLPDMLEGEPLPFREELFARLHEELMEPNEEKEPSGE
jgi:predicted metallopeptidase